MRYTQDEFDDLIRKKVADHLTNKSDFNAGLTPRPRRKFFSNDSGGFKGLGEFAKEVAKAGVVLKKGIGEIDPRLETKAAGTPASHEYEPDYGGFLIPPQFQAELLEVSLNNSNILANAMELPMEVSTLNIPSFQAFDRSSGQLFGGISFQWVEEETPLTGVRPKIGQVGLRLRKLTALAFISNELLEDSPVTIEPLFRRIFSEALTWVLDEAALNGTGAGQPLGILNAPCLITVSAESGQTAGTLVYENVLNMYSRMWDKSKGVWYANDDVLPALATMNLQIGVGGAPVFTPAGGASQKPYDTLFGKPIYFTEHASTLGTVGDIIFADFSQYLLGMKSSGPRFDTSMHLKFDADQMAYRITLRIDGEPWWASVLTTRHSAKTLSPFIALATRS